MNSSEETVETASNEATVSPGSAATGNASLPAAASSVDVAEPQPARPEPKPKSSRTTVLRLMLLAGIGAGGYYAYGYWTEGRFLISTDDAYVRADMSVIASKVAGYITAVPIVENASVAAGAVLAQIDPRDYEFALDAAKNKAATQDSTIARLKEQATAQNALIAQAKAQVASSAANVQRANADFERASTLLQQEVGSRRTLDIARADRDQGQASLQAAQASQLAAQATLAVLNAQVKEAERLRAELQTSIDKAELDLSFTTVRAPVSGIVGNKAVQIGQYVQPGTRLLAIVPLGSIYIEANYKETQLERIRAGQKADVAVDAAGGKSFSGVVESIAPASGSQFSLLPPENATGNFTKIVQRVPVRIRVPADAIADGALRPGLSVVTYVHTKDASNAPETAHAEPRAGITAANATQR